MKNRMVTFTLIETNTPFLSEKERVNIVIEDSKKNQKGMFFIENNGKKYIGLRGGSSPSKRPVGDSTSFFWMGSVVTKIEGLS